ncbi:acetyl esterase [Xanthomonas fragariae]|uniref:Acetyl esterase n=1 Tax=Xanthomonas fragariae TaxID=48664 RepID=A0A1Y6HDZ2_9XANT|nr:hypothetical protein [Xanthomonas fragariae]ENZ95178.1 esterase [Xanthomonas fragariae LMG 25863]SMQ93689.1 acetyl esterase [Xanthomonas fragariae]SMR01734.1 acetyl esterase [Xanthomonas fragariae]
MFGIGIVPGRVGALLAAPLTVVSFVIDQTSVRAGSVGYTDGDCWAETDVTRAFLQWWLWGVNQVCMSWDRPGHAFHLTDKLPESQQALRVAARFFEQPSGSATTAAGDIALTPR